MTVGPWNKWLRDSSDWIHELLSADTVERRSRVAGRAGVPAEDVAKARKLLKAVAATIASGDQTAWRRLAVAYDVIDVGGAFVDEEPDRDLPVDSTMPAVLPMPAEAQVDPGTSIDETVTIDDELRLDLDEGPLHQRSAASAPAGSTLMEGRAPPQAHGGTVQMPIHMPAQITPRSAAASSRQASSSHGGTTPMQPVPSSVLDIEKYAVLCAWTEVHPERREQLHQQYGLSGEAERRQLDERFQTLFTKNAQMRSAFDRRLQLHLGFLRR